MMSRKTTFTRWHKSSRSSGGDNCVEIAFAADGAVGIRDSKHHGAGPVLSFTPGEWAAFIGGAKTGAFDQG
jgi:hypothetical protein